MRNVTNEPSAEKQLAHSSAFDSRRMNNSRFGIRLPREIRKKSQKTRASARWNIYSLIMFFPEQLARQPGAQSSSSRIFAAGPVGSSAPVVLLVTSMFLGRRGIRHVSPRAREERKREIERGPRFRATAGRPARFRSLYTFAGQGPVRRDQRSQVCVGRAPSVCERREEAGVSQLFLARPFARRTSQTCRV